LALDAAGNLYMDGCTDSSDFPVTPGSLQTAFKGGDDLGYCGPSDLFVTKISVGWSKVPSPPIIHGAVTDDRPPLSFRRFSQVSGRE